MDKKKQKGVDSTLKIMYNDSEVKKDLMERVSAALDVVLEVGFGKIKVKIDTERERYTVSYKTNIRSAKK